MPDNVPWKIRVGAALPGWAIEPARGAYRSWHARRFGHLAPLFQTSIPKSGTHLMRSALVAAGYRFAGHQPFNPDVLIAPDFESLARGLDSMRRAEFVTEHVAWSPEIERKLADLGQKVVLVHRDPRAVALSFAHYATNKHARFGEYFKALPGLHERIAAVLDGFGAGQVDGPPRVGLPKLYDAFQPWLASPVCCSVSFEELVGASGGGNDLTQLAALHKVFEFLGIPHPREAAMRVAGKVFDTRSATYRRGSIEAWREELPAKTIEMLNERLADQIKAWGYA